MKRALACLGLVACVHAVATPTKTSARGTPKAMARAEVAAAAPLPAQRRIDLPIVYLFEGKEPGAEHSAGTLIVVRVESDGARERYWLEEIDVASMRAFHAKDLGARSPVAVQATKNVVYVLTTDGVATHTLVALDANGFGEIASSRVATPVPDRFADHAAPTALTIGTRGVLVSYRGQCPKGTARAEDGCLFYETHQLGDLAVAKVRRYAFDRMWDFSRPEIHVPDDWGEPPAQPAAKGPSEDACPFHGTILLGAAIVGDRYFMATSGCCGGPRGGFFECDAPK